MPTTATIRGYGSTTNQNVLKVAFLYPLSSKVRYVCYDNDQTFPATSSLTTTSNAIFGKSGSELSMIGLHDVTSAGPAVTNWFPAATRPNTGSMNLMVGLVSYVTQQGATLSAASGSIYFNMQVKVVASVETDDVMKYDLALIYTFTSTTPTLNWYFNAGTEGAPTWTFATPDVVGIAHTRADIDNSPYLANIPSTGQEKTARGWVAATLSS